MKRRVSTRWFHTSRDGLRARYRLYLNNPRTPVGGIRRSSSFGQDVSPNKENKEAPILSLSFLVLSLQFQRRVGF